MFLLLFSGCEEEQTNTTLIINNNTDYTLINVKFYWDWNRKNYEYGNLNSGTTVTREIVSGTFVSSNNEEIGEIIFNLITSNGNILCKIRPISIKNYKNEYTIANDTTVNYSNNKSDTIKDLAGPLKTATLIINNMTDYNLYNVEYASVSFGNINSGKDSRKNVSPGTKFIYFDLKPSSGDVRCRTEPFTSLDDSNSIIINNNTIITIMGGGVSNTLKNIFESLN